MLVGFSDVQTAKQDLMRNNVIISARNNLIRQDRRLSGRVIDVEQLTASVVYQTTKSVNDAVHFQHHVYYGEQPVVVLPIILIFGFSLGRCYLFRATDKVPRSSNPSYRKRNAGRHAERGYGI